MRNPLSRFADALSAAGQQSPELKRRLGSGVHVPGNVETVPAPEDLADEYDLARETPFVIASYYQFASDVLAPGHRVEADSDETQEWFNDEFLPEAGVVAGERNQDFAGILTQAVVQYLAAGNILTEKVKADPTASNPTYTGFMHIRPESVKLVTQDDRPILVDPDADVSGRTAEIPDTKRGETPAYLQYHEGSLLGQRGRYTDRNVVALSTNDVIKVARNPVPGEIWGDSATHSFADLLRGLKQILKDNEKAIQSKAYGIWSVAFGRELIEDPTSGDAELIEWSEDAQTEFIENKIGREMGPGDIVGHDGLVDFEKFEGEVASDLLDVIELYVKLIVSALPNPLYSVGFESDINQFVTQAQEPRYEASVREMRETLVDAFQPPLEEIAEQQGLPTEGFALRIEPEVDESPIHALDSDAMERMNQLTSSFADVFGPGEAAAHIDDEKLAELVLQLPDDAFGEEIEDVPDLDESDENVQAQFREQQEAVADGGTETDTDSDGTDDA